MFGKKLIVIAATAALALGSISAKESTVHVRVHTNSKVVCNGPGQSPMSVEGAGTYCVTGQACVATISNGACPGPQPGLESGSHCGIVKTGVYGCKPGPPPAAGAAKCDGPGQSPMSVEGAGTYCVTGQACVATISNGACPAAQPGLESGSHCAQVRPGVWGCRKGPKPAHHKHHKHHKSHSKVVCNGPGQSPMSVEGAGTYCVTGQACVATISNGACPAAQPGLESGSHCAQVRPGVWGCRKGPKPAGNSTIVVVIDVEDSEDSDDAVKISDDSIDSADETEDSEDSEDSDDADDANDEDSEDSESDDRRQ